MYFNLKTYFISIIYSLNYLDILKILEIKIIYNNNSNIFNIKIKVRFYILISNREYIFIIQVYY